MMNGSLKTVKAKERGLVSSRMDEGGGGGRRRKEKENENKNENFAERREMDEVKK